MVDVTVASFEEMEPIYDGMARRARATLGVTSFGMQVMTLPGNWDGYPNHNHSSDAFDPNQGRPPATDASSSTNSTSRMPASQRSRQS